MIETTNAGYTRTTLSTLAQNSVMIWLGRGHGVLKTGQATLVAASGSLTRPIPLPSGSSGVTAAAFTSPRRGWLLASGTFGPIALYRTDTAGETWTPIPVTSGSVMAWRGLDIVVLGGQVVVSIDGGQHWSQHTFGDSSVILESATWNDGTLWVFGTRGPASTPAIQTWSQGQGFGTRWRPGSNPCR
ncbi:MAG: hypothetical protein M0Z54_04455 [Thermaerobacter sp.]|nr:hypothetical protein [Thermaerobacter sp.]